MRIAPALALLALAPLCSARPRVIVLVVDGLRPDSITNEVTPNLYRLKQEGTWCANAHSVFPTVTRVNSSSISTGATPAAHGIVSNTMYVAGVDSKPFDTGNYETLVKLAEVSGGRTLAVTTLAEVLEKAGISFAAVNSGSSGSAYLLNPTAPKGTGVLINGGFEGGKRVAFPDKIDQAIQKRFGAEKSNAGIPSLVWTERVLREYVLTELHPEVMIDWLTEPDGTQHKHGVGSPEAIAVLKKMDEQVGLLLARLRELSLEATTDIIVTADHGFASEPDPVDLQGALKATGKSDDIIPASNGSSVLLYVKDRDPETIQKVVSQLQQTDGVDVLFTSARRPEKGAIDCRAGAEQGWVPGTFALELVDQCRAVHGADVIATMQWSSTPNEFGVPGVQRIATTDTRRNVPGRSGHGGLDPWMIHTPMVMWGPDFRKRSVVNAPVANFDIAPTILALEGVSLPATMQGRVIRESFAKPQSAEPKPKVRTIQTRAGAYCATIQVSSVGSRMYIDQGQRCR